MKNTIALLRGRESSYDLYDAINELIEWRLDAIQEAIIQEENLEEAERLFPRIRGLGLEFLKISYLYDTIVKKIVVAGGGDHNDLALYTYSATIGDNMYDMLSENFELVLYIENQRIVPVLALCDSRELSRKMYSISKKRLRLKIINCSFNTRGIPSSIRGIHHHHLILKGWRKNLLSRMISRIGQFRSILLKVKGSITLPFIFSYFMRFSTMSG